MKTYQQIVLVLIKNVHFHFFLFLQCTLYNLTFGFGNRENGREGGWGDFWFDQYLDVRGHKMLNYGVNKHKLSLMQTSFGFYFDITQTLEIF